MFATTNTNEDNFNEIIEIVQAVKRHLQEPNCVHGLRYIISEAYQNKSKKANASARGTTTAVDDAINLRSNEIDYRE
jgi:hypothetical protein